MRLWREWIPSVWIKPGTITAGTMCVEQVQPYVEGMEIWRSRNPMGGECEEKESSRNGAEAQSEVSVVAELADRRFRVREIHRA